MKRPVSILLIALILCLGACDGTAQTFPDTTTVATGINIVTEEATDRIDPGGEKFVWEKEGAGGDFTITLNEDGTYQYYEGHYSSYIGIGTWTVEDGILTLKEASRYDSIFHFSIEDGALIFVAEGSSEFLYVTVEDGDRFLPCDTPVTDPIAPVPVLVIEAGGRTFYAALEDNSSAQALTERLSAEPITVDMQDYGGFEKVGPLPWELPRNDAQITTKPGDVILYQGSQITVYYGENTWSFTKLASIGGVTGAELQEAFGSGGVSVTFRIEWSE